MCANIFSFKVFENIYFDNSHRHNTDCLCLYVSIFFHRCQYPTSFLSLSLIPLPSLCTECSLKLVFFSQFIASHALHVGDRLVYGHSYWLPPFSERPIKAQYWRGRSSTVLKLLEKKQNI